MSDKVEQPIYTFQCNRCFIISGWMSKNTEDAPTCCGGERMRPILANSRAIEDAAKTRDES